MRQEQRLRGERVTAMRLKLDLRDFYNSSRDIDRA